MPHRRKKACGILLALLVLSAALPASAAEPAPLDYAQPRFWICRPDKTSSCRDDLTLSAIMADGSAHREPFIPAKAPAVDCFYVYPTVSDGPGPSAPQTISENERRAVRQQFQRFASICRLYAPLYRQITATSVKAAMAGKPMEGMSEAARLAEADVGSAWKTYLANDNHGRGVILIGHSQGAGMLIGLMRREIDGLPIQKQLIAAIVPGNGATAPRGLDVGGTFKSIPACRSASQIGCVIVFNSYRAGHLIPAAQVLKSEDGQIPLCTNPAALAGGRGALKPILSAHGETIIPDFTAPQGPWTVPAVAVNTPFVALPGLLDAECKTDEHGVYLEISTASKPGDRRTGQFTGDWIFAGRADLTMGLHLIDLNLTMGDLLDILGRQITAYEARTD